MNVCSHTYSIRVNIGQTVWVLRLEGHECRGRQKGIC